MTPMIVFLATLSILATILWYGNTLIHRQYGRTVLAGFVASLSQWIFFQCIGYKPMQAMMYTALIFICMVAVWFVIEWKQAKPQKTGWEPSAAFWVYFLGGIVSSVSVCQLII